MQLAEITDQTAWDQLIDGHPMGHPLQLWGWGDAKRSTNWRPHRLAIRRGDETIAAAQVLLWPIPKLGKVIAYIPRGPVIDPASPDLKACLKLLADWAKQRNALYLRVEPAWRNAPMPTGWRPARDTILMYQTDIINLEQSEEELQSQMKRKARQYIRKAAEDGVTIVRDQAGEYLEAFWSIYSETAQRADFGLHSFDYYRELFEALGSHNELYIALLEDQPVAFLWNTAAAGVAFELYGGVSAAGQEVRANYALKWHAFAAAKAAGRQLYDFNGRVTGGVSQFKAAFGPEEIDYIGTYDYPLNRLGYQLWERAWPMAKPVGRKLLGRRG